MYPVYPSGRDVVEKYAYVTKKNKITDCLINIVRRLSMTRIVVNEPDIQHRVCRLQTSWCCTSNLHVHNDTTLESPLGCRHLRSKSVDCIQPETNDTHQRYGRKARWQSQDIMSRTRSKIADMYIPARCCIVGK